MPFDPNLPQPGTEMDANQIRAQLNALHDEIIIIPQGPPGPEGPPGPAGPQGPPFANAVAGPVQTLPPGSAATVSISFDGVTVQFDFGIPEGLTGPPGEVTQAMLDAAIATTALNPIGLAPLLQPISDPPTQAQVQALQDFGNALLALLLRT